MKRGRLPKMLLRSLAALAAGYCLSLHGAEKASSASPWQVPGDVPEMMAACRDIPALYQFSRNGYLSIECGYQAILLGNRIPIGPAPHIPWAKPYANGPLKVLSICMFGYAPADTAQLAQVARELDCDMRFVLVANVPVNHEFGKDEAYRLGFLAEQARTALKEEYDVILLAMGSYSPGYGYPLVSAIFPDDVYQSILAKAKAGTGLVFVGSNLGGWWVEKTALLEASPATMTGQSWRLEKPDVALAPEGASVLAGLTFQNVPKFPLYGWKLREGTQVLATESGRPVLMSGTYGKGRTLLCGWDGTLSVAGTAEPRLAFEQGMAITLRAIAYAAGKEPPVRVLPELATLVAGSPGRIEVAVSAPATLECVLRSGEFEALVRTSVQAKAAGTAALPMPPLPAGAYWLEVIARDRKGASLGWGTAPVSVSCESQLVLSTDKQSVRLGDRLGVTGEVCGPTVGDRLHVEISDSAGRLLVMRESPFYGIRFRFEYVVKDRCVAPQKATVTVMNGDVPVLREAIEFFVPDHYWTDYENMLWPNKAVEMTPELRDVAGITAVMDGWGEERFARKAARLGIRSCRMNDGVLSPALMQTDPANGETQQDKTLAKAIDVARKYGTVTWALQDERLCTDDPGMPNAEGLKRFRAHLQTAYGSIEKLNASWERSFKNWDEAMPMLTAELKPETRNFAPWVDFRLYVADQAFQADRRHALMIKEALGHNIPVGIDGFTTSGHAIPFGGLDIGRLLGEEVFDFYCPYGDDLLVASLVQGPMVKYIGWGMSRREYFGNPWRDAFRGHWGTFRFFGSTFYSEFGWVQPAGRWIGEGTRELREGVGRLLMAADRPPDPIAILYSYPSMMTCAAAGVWVEKGNAHLMWRPANWSREAFERMILSCGNSFSYVTAAQAEKGALKDKKVLILSHFMAMALSDATCEAIRQFVGNGGLLVADLAPAVCDEHGRLRGKGGLDDLFGVTRDSFGYAQRATDYLVGVTGNDPLVPPAAWYVGEWYEKGLRISGGNALGKHWFQDVPALVTRKTGTGQALLLNFLHSSAARRNGEPEEDDIKLMEQLLKAAGIAPQVVTETTYGRRERFCEVNTLKDGAIEYVGLYAQKMPTEDPQTMVVRFPEPRMTYDVRQARFLGRTDRAPLALRAQEAALFARLDYEVTGLSVTATSVQGGDAVEAKVVVATTGKPGRHVVRLEVTDPDGKPSYFYSRNVEAKSGTGIEKIATAMNDPKGKWTVVAREVISGRTAKTTFRLK